MPRPHSRESRDEGAAGADRFKTPRDDCGRVDSAKILASKMRAITKIRTAFPLIEPPMVICIISVTSFSLLAQDGFTDDAAIKTFLHDSFDGKKIGMVIGLVDEDGSSVFSAGKLDNITDQEVNGDTVFEIGSITKTFTALLL